ncbi:DUF5123 domain-containing protein [Dysgonomonas termitidis]|uniref:DUF5123 domain-containing protein n=1 Tax=Dysgonomonas termitidis TaxID=1516126 RepID=A0ABV9KRY6_9BACT
MKIPYYILLLSFLSFALISCEEDVNDWGYDERYDRLFRPATFEVENMLPTSVQLKFSGVVNATKYVFEFSEGDSLLFTNITKIVDITTDSLYTLFSNLDSKKSPAAIEFSMPFGGLKGTTPYSVRVKAVDENHNLESGYMQAYFETPDEQIFKSSNSATNKATLFWMPDAEVTHILYWENVGEGQEPVQQTLQLTSEDKLAGRATITGLASGTGYMAVIYNDDAKRGTWSFRTLGINNGRTIRLQAGDASNIDAILIDCVTNGDRTVTLVFDGNQVYEIDKIIVPEGIDLLYMVGDAATDGIQPELYLNNITMSAPMTAIIFQGVDLNARLNSSNYVFDIGNTNCFKGVSFEGCTIRNIGRSLVRLNHEGLNVDYVRISDCIIKNVGVSGYGFINMGKNIVKLGELSIKNSTVMDFGSDRLMQLQGGVVNLIIDKSTLCNFISKSAEVFRFDRQPGSVTVTNSIFTGNNGNSKINAGRNDYSAYLEYPSCYITSDLVINTNPFTNAVSLELTSEDLFVDPQNGDFHFKEGVSFNGRGKAGDPRWW